ncbi:hypothetical protein GCM10022255_053550 [Dactylosporangium darangshiense]|uniref:histidine kinase n=1 Tax=Dactylosporangium darangshiense TaxID=579108 RepID=A0ABP8DDD8_9ACTN
MFDAGVAAGLVLLLYLERMLAPVPVLAAGLLMAVSLLWRRRHPVPVLAAVYALALGHLALRPSVRASAAGLRVTFETAGLSRSLTAAEDLAAYRIVQESVTNALRHAGAGAAITVRLEHSADTLTITATDDGGVAGSVRGRSPATGPALVAPTGSIVGHGLVGMRERTAVHGGTFTAGPHGDGGWRVVATIRLASDARGPADPRSFEGPDPVELESLVAADSGELRSLVAADSDERQLSGGAGAGVVRPVVEADAGGGVV